MYIFIFISKSITITNEESKGELRHKISFHWETWNSKLSLRVRKAAHSK